MSSEAASTTTPAPTTTAPSPVVAAPAPVTAAPTPTPTAETATPAPSATPTPDATAAPSANVVAIQPPQVATQPGAAQVTVQPTPTPGGPEQAGQVPAQAQPGQVAGQIVPGAPGQVVLAPAPGQAGLPPGQIILLPPGQTPGQPGQPATAPDGTPLPVMSMPPTVTSSSATSIAAAAAAAAALAAAMNSTGPAPGTLTGANNTIIPQGMTPVYIPGYPPGTVMTHAQYMQIQGQAAEFAANNQLVNIGGVAQVPPLNPGDLGPHYSHHHFNTYAEFQGWKDSIQSQHGDYIVSGAVRTLKDGCRSFTLVCAVSGPYRKHRHKQGKTEPEVQAIASRPNRSKPSKKQGKMCTARMRIRHDAKDHVYVKFYPVHNHPWNPNDISHLRQLRLTASIKAKIEEQLKLNVPVKQILANVHQYQMADAIAQGATPEQQLQIKREQLINRTDIKNIQYKLQQQAAIARGEIPAKQQKKPNPKRKMVIWNGPGSAPLTFNNVDPNTDPAAAVAAAQAAQAAHQAAQAAQAVQAVQQAAAQAGQQPTSTFTLQAPATTPMDTTPTPIPQTAAQAVAAAMEESAAKRQKLDHPITSAAQAVAVAMNAAQAAAQNAAATAAAQAAAAAAAQAQTAPPTLPPLPAAPPTVLPLPIIPATTTTPTPPPPPPGPAYYSCDICGMGIQGRRWHCQKCADYDVCETCYNKISAETIRRQTSPSSPPSPLFTQLLTNATDPAKHQAIQIHAEGQHPWVEESNAVAPPGSVPAPVVTAASTPAS